MDKGFAFVDGLKTDRLTRRLARSHAMKGKNIGKEHHHRSRLNRGRAPTGRSSVSSPGYQGRVEKVCNNYLAKDELDSACDHSVCPSLALPIFLDTTPQSLNVISNYFTTVLEAVYFPRLCLSLGSIKTYWIYRMCMDLTSYHCSLALMSTLNGFVFATEAEPPEAMHHLGKAVRLVNQSLDTADGLSNSNIFVVNFLAVRDMFREEQPNVDIHWQGLQKMIKLRGGLSQLEDDLHLILKIHKTDIDYALRYGTSTTFYRDNMPLKFHKTVHDGNIMMFDNGQSVYKMNRCLYRILLDVHSLTHWFNLCEQNFVEPEDLQETIISIGYRLIRFQTLGESELESTLEAAYHIGLLAFLTTFFLQVSGRHFLKYNLINRCLKSAVERQQDAGNQYSVVWLLLVGGISVLTEVDHPWLVPKIRHATRCAGIESWTQLRLVLGQFPWIHAIHDEPGAALWETAMARAGGADIG
ncbi:hypothetical protein BX600DRAFT_100372 [Xylariales sp. PMI_506]|nr:hypothetical protein BX600DRAFT_100372 [Xylariales sp. PMI_506]